MSSTRPVFGSWPTLKKNFRADDDGEQSTRQQPGGFPLSKDPPGQLVSAESTKKRVLPLVGPFKGLNSAGETGSWEYILLIGLCRWKFRPMREQGIEIIV